MFRFIYADQLDQFPTLKDTMFRDRAEQFKNRLGWDVSVDENGYEMDEYDAKNPLYVIWENADGTHGGSMRFLPTTSETMINDHFVHLTEGVRIESPFIWECTRFCLAPDADRRVTAALVLAAAEIMENYCLQQFVGVFDPRMERIYSLLGVCPEVIGRKDDIGVGLWGFNEEHRDRVHRRARVTREEARSWFKLSMNRGSSEAVMNAEPEYAVA